MGQKNYIKVLRLVSKYSIEEKIIEIATKKLLLEEIIINPINKLNKEDLESVLRNGSFELFNKNIDEKDEEEFTDEQIDELLLRNNIKVTKSKNVKKTINDYYLSGFKFQSMTIQNYEENTENANNSEKLKFWENLLSNEAEKLRNHEETELGKGKRLKKLLNNFKEDNESGEICNLLLMVFYLLDELIY